MTKYVLEILDGDQAGETISLGQERVTIGRKPGNGLVIRDEKCSGEHAEIAFEDGGYVVRDLGSTNGTMLDGNRISEVALSPFDIVTFGRVRAVFKAEGAEAPVDDLRVVRVDESRLAGRRRGSGAVAVGVVLVLVGAGVAAWLQFFRPQAAAGGPAVRIVSVSGNKLETGTDNFEGDGGWNLQAGGAGFDLTAGRANAHSGRTAIEASYSSDGEVGPQRWSLARLAGPIRATSGTPLSLQGFARTRGGATVSLRLRFSSSDDGTSLVSALVPESYPDGFTATEPLVAKVPRGMDQVEVEILGLHPAEGDEVAVDDVALVASSGPASATAEFVATNGVALSATGSSLWATSGDDIVIAGVDPIVDDPLLTELLTEGVLTPAEAGLGLTVTDLDGTGFEIEYRRLTERGASGVSLALPRDSAVVMTRAEGGAFLTQPAEFEVAGVNEVLLGTGPARCLLGFERAAAVRSEFRGGDYLLHLPGTLRWSVRVTFADELRRARSLRQEADSAQRSGQRSRALDLVATLEAEVPHSEQELAQARQIRSALMAEMRERIAALRIEGTSAGFFDARVGYVRTSDGLRELIATYGEQHVEELDSLRELELAMQSGIDRIDQRRGTEHGERLARLQSALDDSGQELLAKMIDEYVKKHYGK